MNRCARCFGDMADLTVFCPNCAQVNEPDFGQLIDRVIDEKYRISRRLGQGGLSTVFAAFDERDGSEVVIKVSDPAQLARRDASYSINAEDARNYWSEMLERMRREAETLSRIDHPNIVRFYGTGSIGEDLRYVAMERLHGLTLRDELDRTGPPEISRALDIAMNIASALSEVHSRGIIHRDINPGNIFIDCESEDEHDGSRIKLIDFGIARFPGPPGAPPFTQHSVLSGTISYSSPEQCQSRPLDHRTDIYSLGVVLYEMLTGQRPFTGRTTTEIALKQIQSDPAPPRSINPEIPAGVERAILRALAKNPDERQQNIAELASELRSGVNPIIIPLQSEENEDLQDVVDEDFELKQVRRRRRRTAATIAALIIATSAAGVFFARQWLSSKTAPPAISENSPATPAQTVSPSTTASPATTAGSDADSLELAARLSAQPQSAPRTVMQPMAQPGAAKPAISKPAPTPTIQTRSTTIRQHQADSRESARAPVKQGRTEPPPAPRSTAPWNPPAPSPAIVTAKIPQPSSQPDVSQAPTTRPRRQNEPSNVPLEAEQRRENDPPINKEPIQPVRPDIRKRENADVYRENIGPKLIQWSGSVNREREIKIEMPGIPGTIEIPRIYRDRVGVVEPPNSGNGWNYAVLRVFGRGNVSIIIRWWPAQTPLQ